MYDEQDFAGRFRLQLAMIGMLVLIGLSRLVHTRVAYEIAIAKIIAEICRISHY